MLAGALPKYTCPLQKMLLQIAPVRGTGEQSLVVQDKEVVHAYATLTRCTLRTSLTLQLSVTDADSFKKLAFSQSQDQYHTPFEVMTTLSV